MKTITLDGIEYQLTPITTEAQKPVQWQPKRLDRDQKYWYVNSTSTINHSKENFLIADDHRVSFGNYFYTEQEAEEAAKQVRQLLRLRAYVREFAPDYKPNWNDPIGQKWYVYFDGGKNKWFYSYSQSAQNVTTVYMPHSTATNLVRKLNSGEVVL